ncbi:TetR/AcrR family transcriptional regulator [Nocardia donostiensis]|uniref:TetR family transcriptional regulator n=1 Tax=Nocardia donostiensis TaxID=1538463 RepID=A0A1V2TG73_9NOCA|nr:TetR/AcrR family transcriptional regulator C-terminal domain-containing protein [Nocardia donostiensis]ONM48381.1 TetR family transcriptional regulator [Nocardia donostiensis]OQS12624.1 TetR family transcriptional regulator [Nocardia donostiensis]OQS20508.1 TetR family transcriptional regulator [Nocardia donostiensis]
MPRPRSLSNDQLVAATLAVIDRDGLSALTMRAVAKELGMATMGLYRYVSDRQALEVLVVDHVFHSVDLTLPDVDWTDRIRLLLGRVRVAVAKHPAVVPLVLRHRQACTGSLRLIETMLSVLTDGGYGGVDRVIAQRTLIDYLLGFLQNEHYAALSGAGTITMSELSPEDYPHLSRTAADARSVPADEEFRRGLDIVLRGLASSRAASTDT